MLNEASDFCPNWKSPPGDTIIEMLDERELSVEAFSQLINETTSFASRLVAGTEPITHELAMKLSNVLGASTDFWLARDYDFRDATELDIQLKTSADLYNSLPIADMKKFGWISGARSREEVVQQCLEFFGVSTIPQWVGQYGQKALGPAYRKSSTFTDNEFATIAWLRQAEKVSECKVVNEWNSEDLKKQIPALRKLSWFKDPQLFLTKLEQILATAGVKFAVIKAPKGCTASGATRFLKDGTPLIQVSFRYLSDDQFWFTVFHEIAHLLLHAEHLPFYEIKGMEIDHFENEANEFASSIIIPPYFYEEFLDIKSSSKAVMKFAKKCGIAPGLIVGQMQYNNMINFNQLNFLKRRYRWA